MDDGLTIRELCLLFAGEPADGGGYLTDPWPTAPLASAICRWVRPRTLAELRAAVYGDLTDDVLNTDDLQILRLGFERWAKH